MAAKLTETSKVPMTNFFSEERTLRVGRIAMAHKSKKGSLAFETPSIRFYWSWWQTQKIQAQRPHRSGLNEPQALEVLRTLALRIRTTQSLRSYDLGKTAFVSTYMYTYMCIYIYMS